MAVLCAARARALRSPAHGDAGGRQRSGRLCCFRFDTAGGHSPTLPPTRPSQIINGWMIHQRVWPPGANNAVRRCYDSDEQQTALIGDYNIAQVLYRFAAADESVIVRVQFIPNPQRMFPFTIEFLISHVLIKI